MNETQQGERLLDNPPNLREVKCCGNCQHSDYSEFKLWVCMKFGEVEIQPYQICDQFAEITQEYINSL